MYQHLLTENNNGILLITINREDKMNALNLALLGELKDIVKNAIEDSAVKGIILTGKGPKAFAAGADIAEFSSFKPEQGKEMAASGHAIFKMIETCPKPFIAAVNGFALGGGCELAMSCHFRLATENAKFGQPEINLGIIPGYGGTQRLVQLIGKGKALELLMTGDMVNAAEAQRLGLVNHTYASQEEMMTAAEGFIEKIAGKAPIAIAKVVEAVDAFFTDGKDGFATEVDLFASCMSTNDFKEGTAAFVEKRKANFKGN
jgi:enoyl-CoA hydratase